MMQLVHVFFFFLIIRRPPISTLFPYPTLSRSRFGEEDEPRAEPARRAAPGERREIGAPVPRHQLAQTRGLERLGELMARSEEHTSELQSRLHLVCRLLLEKKKRRQDANPAAAL